MSVHCPRDELHSEGLGLLPMPAPRSAERW